MKEIKYYKRTSKAEFKDDMDAHIEFMIVNNKIIIINSYLTRPALIRKEG